MTGVSLTVLMPVYNGARYLDRSISSILEQSYRGFRFLIIDDASSDATPDILKRYEAVDSRVEVVRNHRNMGLTKSLNKGLSLCEGEFVARMDCDDVSLSERFERQVDFLKQNPEVAMVGVAWKEMSSTLETTLRVMRPPTQYSRIKKDILGHNLFCHSAVMMRLGHILKIGGYSERDLYSQDYELWLRLIARYPVTNIGEIHHLRRIHQENISQKNIQKQLRTMARSQLKYIKTTDIPSFYSVYAYKSFFLSCLPVWFLTLLSRVNRRRSPF